MLHMRSIDPDANQYLDQDPDMQIMDLIAQDIAINPRVAPEYQNKLEP